MSTIDRRSFMKTALAAPVVSTLGLQGAAMSQDATPEPMSFPCGKIGPLQISRMLLGGNLLTHFTHSRDLQYVYNLAAHYNTDEKIIETLKISEQHGVNTLVVHTVPHVIELLANYRKEQGGKIQWIVCPTAQPDTDRAGYIQQVKELVAEKCEAIYLWGVSGDRLSSEGKIDALKDAVAIAHDAGVPSGVGGHDLNVIRVCEDNNVPADFYVKTFHHHNYATAPKPEEINGPHAEIPGYWCREPQDTIDVMAAVEKPWFAFKVMAAGAIPPKDGFHYAFDNGADHILAGMFDFEIAEDVEFAKDALALTAQRNRPWRS